MRRDEVQAAAIAFGNAIGAEIPPGMVFVLVVAANADPGDAVQVHTSTATNMDGESVALVLGQVLHSASAHAEAIKPDGRTVDLTPRGPAS